MHALHNGIHAKPEFLTAEYYILTDFASGRSDRGILCGGKFAISVVPYSMFKEYGADADGVDDVVSALRIGSPRY